MVSFDHVCLIIYDNSDAVLCPTYRSLPAAGNLHCNVCARIKSNFTRNPRVKIKKVGCFPPDLPAPPASRAGQTGGGPGGRARRPACGVYQLARQVVCRLYKRSNCAGPQHRPAPPCCRSCCCSPSLASPGSRTPTRTGSSTHRSSPLLMVRSRDLANACQCL